MRRSLRRPAHFVGVGLHGGQQVRASVLPAASGAGIAFRRSDLGPAKPIPAHYGQVTDTRLCTRLGDPAGASVGTVEHLMAALAGAGIDDALVVVDGPEVPIMDGSAGAFLQGFVAAGIVERRGARRAIRILAPVEVEDGAKTARLEPAPTFSMEFRIAFADPAIGEQALALDLAGSRFAEELADCRTFGHLSEVEHLRRLGLARGGSLENAIVVDRGRVLNPGGLRRPDEFVRHKMLDAVGDLALAGAPILGRYVAARAGHDLTNRLLHALFARPDAWAWADAPPAATPVAPAALPPLPEPAEARAG